MNRVTLERPWIEFDLGAEMQVLSWAVDRPGLVTARRILWREVRNSDLPPDLDVTEWFAGELAQRGCEDAVAFLTSRDVRRYCEASATVEGITAHAVATAGLSNAERAGSRMDYASRNWGTINVALAPLRRADPRRADRGDEHCRPGPHRRGDGGGHRPAKRNRDWLRNRLCRGGGTGWCNSLCRTAYRYRRSHRQSRLPGCPSGRPGMEINQQEGSTCLSFNRCSKTR